MKQQCTGRLRRSEGQGKRVRPPEWTQEAGPAAPSGVARGAICPVHLRPSTAAAVITKGTKNNFSITIFELDTFTIICSNTEFGQILI